MRTQHALMELVSLFIPHRCAACGRGLARVERRICRHCTADLPLTRFHDDPLNPVEQLFRGRLPLHAASAYLKFGAHGKVQRMLHQLKYKSDREVGEELGERMAQEALTCPRFADVDVLVAVPLHPAKLIQRGYNQAQVLVDGMRQVWPIDTLDAGLLRVLRTTTQTRKGRLDRWTNVRDAFALGASDRLAGKHVLLVDDVITTGATIEACAQAVLAVPDTRVSVFSCACA